MFVKHLHVYVYTYIHHIHTSVCMHVPSCASRGQMKKGGSLPDSRVAEQFS